MQRKQFRKEEKNWFHVNLRALSQALIFSKNPVPVFVEFENQKTKFFIITGFKEEPCIESEKYDARFSLLLKEEETEKTFEGRAYRKKATPESFDCWIGIPEPQFVELMAR